MIKDNNYIVIPGWVSTKLGLKGNALIVYSIIYGFCQDGHSCFHGSLEYLQEWTNSTRQGVIKTLKYLLEEKLIRKEESYPNNKYYLYDASMYKNIVNNVNTDVNKVTNEVNNVNTDCKQSLHNNKDNNKEEYTKQKDISEKASTIINYLNKICSTSFRTTSNGSIKYIKARLKEGFSLEDFYSVIDYKYNDWGKSPKKFSNGQWSNSYLRPSTLFGNKMEEYLQQAWMYQLSTEQDVKSVNKSDDRSNLEF